MSKTVSPTPKYLSAIPLKVLSGIALVWTLCIIQRSGFCARQAMRTHWKPLDRLIPASTVETKTASAP